MKPERIFRVFPFREDVSESEREYVKQRLMNASRKAFDEYFELMEAQAGNNGDNPNDSITPEQDHPGLLEQDIAKEVDALYEGNLSEVVFSKTYFELVANRHLFDPHPAFEGFMKCLAMHWIGGFKMLVAGLEESMPDGCLCPVVQENKSLLSQTLSPKNFLNLKRPDGLQQLVPNGDSTGGSKSTMGGTKELQPWNKAFRSPFPMVEKQVLSGVSKAKGAQDTWDLYMNEKEKNRRNLLWKYHIVPHMTNYAPKTLETLRMMHRGFTGVRAVFGRRGS